MICVPHAWHAYCSTNGNNSSIGAADFIQYVNDNRYVLRIKCETEGINAKQSFANEDIQEHDCVLNAQVGDFQ